MKDIYEVSECLGRKASVLITHRTFHLHIKCLIFLSEFVKLDFELKKYFKVEKMFLWLIFIVTFKTQIDAKTVLRWPSLVYMAIIELASLTLKQKCK